MSFQLEEEFFAEYEGKSKGERLDSSDAIFVDVIHTSANSNPYWTPTPIGNKEKVRMYIVVTPTMQNLGIIKVRLLSFFTRYISLFSFVAWRH